MSVLVAVAALSVESAMLIAYVEHDLPLSLFLLLHALVIAALFGVLRGQWYKRKSINNWALLLLAAFGAGALGIAGFLLFLLLRKLYAKFMTPASVWFAGLFPEEHLSGFDQIFRRVQSGWDDYSSLAETSSFQDLFTNGTLAQKQAVLDVIVKELSPSFMPILKQALKDPLNAVRIQAAAIVTKIDLDFEKKRLELQKQPLQEEAVLLALAKHCDLYASLAILDPLRQKEIAREAIRWYRDYLQKKPEDQNSWFAIGRLLFHAGDFIPFLEWCDTYRTHFKGLPAIVHSWQLEALYRLHRYAELAVTARATL
jgi:hypothetical protein